MQELGLQRGVCEIVRRQRRQIGRALDPRQLRPEARGTLVVARRPTAPVEHPVDRRGRRLDGSLGQQEHDREVLRKVDRLECRAVAGTELWAVVEEERNVGAEAGSELVELARLERIVELRVREQQRGGGVRAPAAESGGDGHALLDANPPAVRRIECLERAADERVGRESLDRGVGSRLDVDAVGQIDALEERDELVLAVGAHGARRRAPG